MASIGPRVVIEQLASTSSSAGIGHIRFYTLDRISDTKPMVEHHSRESQSPEPRPESVAVASSYSR